MSYSNACAPAFAVWNICVKISLNAENLKLMNGSEKWLIVHVTFIKKYLK